VRSDLEFQRVYEFLSRLRSEFEPRLAQLIARGRIPLSVVLSELHVEETRLRGAGLLGVPSVLAARAPTMLAAAPGPSRSSAPPLLATPSDGMGRSSSGGGGRLFRGGGRSHPSRIQCGYCQMPGHSETDCYKKMLDMGHASSTGTRPPSSSPSLSVQDIATLRRILAASCSSSSIGTARSVTVVSRTERPPSP
jgi:hypothetical protein